MNGDVVKGEARPREEAEVNTADFHPAAEPALQRPRDLRPDKIDRKPRRRDAHGGHQQRCGYQKPLHFRLPASRR